MEGRHNRGHGHSEGGREFFDGIGVGIKILVAGEVQRMSTSGRLRRRRRGKEGSARDAERRKNNIGGWNGGKSVAFWEQGHGQRGGEIGLGRGGGRCGESGRKRQHGRHSEEVGKRRRMWRALAIRKPETEVAGTWRAVFLIGTGTD
jgi:hypothetical protein